MTHPDEAVKFTPGPWRTGREDMTSECGCGATYRNIYAEDARGGFHHVTMQPLPLTVGKAIIEPLYGAIHEMQITEAEFDANARLIAAAPELYAALLEALPILEEMENDVFFTLGEVAQESHDGSAKPNRWQQATLDRANRARAALAKVGEP